MLIFHMLIYSYLHANNDCFIQSNKSKSSAVLSHFLRVVISLTGSNVLLLRNNLSCGVHLLFALLCGRPVVVLAEPRNERFVPFTLHLIFTI